MSVRDIPSGADCQSAGVLRLNETCDVSILRQQQVTSGRRDLLFCSGYRDGQGMTRSGDEGIGFVGGGEVFGIRDLGLA